MHASGPQRVATLILLLLAAACGRGETDFPIRVNETLSSPPGLPGPAGDPGVALAAPVDGAVNVPVDAPVRLVFAAVPDPLEGIGLDGIGLRGPAGPVPATVAAGAAEGEVVLTPKAPLAPGTTYLVVVAAGTPGAEGAMLGTSRAWEFTTAAAPGPPLVAPLPPSGGGGVWSGGAWVDPLGTPVAVALETVGVPRAARWSVSGPTALYAAAAPLAADTVHRLRVTATDPMGGPLAELELPFAVGWADVTPTGLTAPLRDVALLTGARAVAAGAGGTLRATFDGGLSWQALDSGTAEDLNALHFVTPDAGWAVGTGGTLLRTTDGATWGPVASPTGAELLDVTFFGAKRGIAVGGGGTILVTADGGGAWTPVAAPTSDRLNHVACVSERICRAVGDRGTILVTGDGGATWAREAAGTGADLLAVAETPEGYRWIVGEGGVVLVAGGGSAAWVVRGATGQPALEDLVFTDADAGWAVGDGSFLIHTEDGGRSWQVQFLPAPARLRAVAARGDHRLIAVGEDPGGAPLVLATDTGGAR